VDSDSRGVETGAVEELGVATRVPSGVCASTLEPSVWDVSIGSGPRH
jgi:hypothetical protein